MLNTNWIVKSGALSLLMMGGALVMAGCNDAGAPAPAPAADPPAGMASTATPAETYGATERDDAPQEHSAAGTARDSDPTIASFLGVRAPKPATWIEHPPQSQMHHTTFHVPGADGGKVAQIVVFFFGRGQGGPIDMNIERWRMQFRSPDGYEVRPEVRELEVDGMEVTLVELEGEYMAQGTRWYTPDQRFISAVVDTPGDQRIFIRFVGDHATVSAHRDAFIRMIEEMEWTGN